MRRKWLALWALAAWPLVAAAEPIPQKIEFNRDIRPIFSDRCFTCHGPDQANRKSKLRFDNEAGAKQDLGGHFAIVPGQPDKSELIRRVSATNKGLRMPPVYAGAGLSAREIELLRRDTLTTQKKAYRIGDRRPVQLQLRTIGNALHPTR